MPMTARKRVNAGIKRLEALIALSPQGVFIEVAPAPLRSWLEAVLLLHIIGDPAPVADRAQSLGGEEGGAQT